MDDLGMAAVMRCALLLFLVLLKTCVSQQSDVTTSTSTPSTNTTQDPSNLCLRWYTCAQCVKVEGAKCYYCSDNSTNNQGCHLYPAANVFPSSSDCPLSQASWGVCWVNFEALIISMSVIAGVLLISLITGIYCCCCRSKRGMVDGTELKWERETHERQQRHADRRVEREAKMSQIRQKYGLNRETPSYDRMA